MLVLALCEPSPSAQIPTSSTPACEIDEYASMRLMLSWRTAVMLPTVIVIAAITTIGLAQPSVPNGTTSPPSAVPNTRIIAATAAALTAAAMNAVTGVGAPSYASGAHMWNGTAATLKPNAMISMKPPATTRPGFWVWPSAVASTEIFVEPAAP